jgi:hypothetical protein
MPNGNSVLDRLIVNMRRHGPRGGFPSTVLDRIMSRYMDNAAIDGSGGTPTPTTPAPVTPTPTVPVTPTPTTPTVPGTPTTTPTTPTTPAAPDFATRLAAARAQAAQNAELFIRSQGLDAAQYMPLINAEFDRRAASILPTDDPRAAFTNDIANSVLLGEQSRRRNEFLNSVGQRFNPGHENAAVPSSLLDDAINSILQEQQGNAQQFLDRGRARGIYNDVGYNAGLSAVNNAASVGRADLSSLGSSVIDRYRGNLDEIGDEAYSVASGWELGNPNFSLDPYVNQYSDVLGRATTNAAGDLRGLLGGRNYFDFGDLGNRAGMAQGATNLRDTDIATALRERRRANSTRGLGSQGAF